MMRVNDIFVSIDGEVNAFGQGRLTTFIRLQGCNLRCKYCDIKGTWDESKGDNLDIIEIRNVWRTMGSSDKITITGGEPLIQFDIFHLIDAFLSIRDVDVHITIETNGTYDVPYMYKVGLKRRLSWVVDYKLNEVVIFKNKFVRHFNSNSWVKFVIDDLSQLDKIRGIVDMLKKEGCGARFAVSAVHDSITPKILIDALIERRLWDVTANFQLHKLLGVK